MIWEYTLFKCRSQYYMGWLKSIIIPVLLGLIQDILRAISYERKKWLVTQVLFHLFDLLNVDL